MSNIVVEAKQQLANYKEKIDDDISFYVKALKTETSKKYSPITAELIQPYLDILSRGGKRLRGALTMHAYFMAGGDNEEIALKSARAIEMLHAYLLAIDDIADESASRRGGPSAHKLLERYHANRNLHGESGHFGTSQATHAALFGAHKAMEEISLLQMDPALKTNAIRFLNDNLVTTIAGQLNDVYNEALRRVSEDEVRRVLTWKTAYYSFLNPLQFGILLAGKDWKDYEWLDEYSIHAGLAFQITDDILGIFADEKKSGKSTLDDLREGKVTLLVAHVLRKASQLDRERFMSHFGKKDLTQKEQKVMKDIIERSGALKEVKEDAESEATRAILSLSKAPEELQRYVRFLDGIAVYITQRNS